MCVFMSTFCKLLRQQRTFLFTREKSNADAKCMSLDSAKMILHEIWFDLIAPPPCRSFSSACIISTHLRILHILSSPFGEGSRQVSFRTCALAASRLVHLSLKRRSLENGKAANGVGGRR